MNKNPVLPKRFKPYGVGKYIGGAVYLHRDYESLILPQAEFQMVKTALPKPFDYTIIKQNFKTGAFSFITSPDFDAADEPYIGNVLVVTPKDGTLNFRVIWYNPTRVKIYHHKWLFVKDDYTGFEVNQSIKRSLSWMKLTGINYSLIGNLEYWEKEIVPRIA